MRTIAVTHTYPRETLSEADAVVNSLEQVTVDLIRKLEAAGRGSGVGDRGSGRRDR
jgi:hypothetical protein